MRIKKVRLVARGGPFHGAPLWLGDSGTTMWFRVVSFDQRFGRYKEGVWQWKT